MQTLGEKSPLELLFSPSVIRRLSQKDGRDYINKFANQIGFKAKHGQTVFDFYKSAYSLMGREKLRSDFVFRNEIVQKRWLHRHSINTATVLSEHRVARSRADLVLINGLATGIEIKSDRDKLNRLSSQLRDYSKVFPKTMVVTGSVHLADVIRMVPKSTGVTELTRRNTLRQIVPAVENYSYIDSDFMAGSMNQEEAKDLLATLGEEIPQKPNTLMWAEIRRKLGEVDHEELCVAYAKVLKTKRSKSVFRAYLSNFPRAVQTALLLGKYGQEEWSKLAATMSLMMEE